MMKRQQWFGKLRLIYGLCILGCNCMWVPSVFEHVFMPLFPILKQWGRKSSSKKLPIGGRNLRLASADSSLSPGASACQAFHFRVAHL